jgi:hypothetical protein
MVFMKSIIKNNKYRSILKNNKDNCFYYYSSVLFCHKYQEDTIHNKTNHCTFQDKFHYYYKKHYHLYYYFNNKAIKL